MKIENGLYPNMVLQRNTKGQCDASFCGECKTNGQLVALVLLKGTAKKAKPIIAGTAAQGRFSGRLKGIKTGGPYTITLAIVDKSGKTTEKMNIPNILVGDVWMLAGQSNMAGYGLLKHARKPSPMVRAFYMDNHWGTAKDPINVTQQAVDPTHLFINGGVVTPRSPHTGTGPGVAFGQEMHAITGVPQGVIASAHGGTSMAQWNPELKDQHGKSLYAAMLKRLHLNGGKVAGIVWYQGCNETNPQDEPHYTENMVRFVKAVRRDFRDSKLPFVAVQISRVCGRMSLPKYWNSIQEQQRNLPDKIKHLALVSTIDLSLDDIIHIGGEDAHRVGARCARAMSHLKGLGKKRLLPPPSLKGIRFERNPIDSMANVRVQFKNIVGDLRSFGRPSGFDISPSPSLILNDFVYRIDLEGDTAVIRTVVPFNDIEGKYLYYGFGNNPYCNITDSQDNAIPFMGPLVIGRERAITPYITTWRVSPILPSAGKLDSLACPNIAELMLNEIRFAEKRDPFYMENFCNLHAEIAQTAPSDGVVFYEIEIKCSEKMQLNLLLGYDGPVKVWFDGRMIYHDPNGTNPANASKGVVPVEPQAGQHKMLIALGTNNAKAWGIFARFERRDVVFKKDQPASFAMPEFS